MKKYLFLAVLSVLSLPLLAQKVVYDANAEIRNVKGFHSIKVSSGIDLYISAGDEAVAISAKDAEHKSRIKTEVENGVLKIWYDTKDGRNFHFGTTKGMKAYVSYKELRALSASGGSDVISDGVIQSNNLVLNISGGSDFKGSVNAQEVNVNVSGGSDVKLSGRVNKATINASGGSDFTGFDFIAETAKLEASGGSDIHITVNKELTARASGGSDISYKGTAVATDIHSSGSGSIKKSSR